MRRAAAATLAAGLMVVLFATPATGHAELRDTEPANGARLERAPGQVVLRFTESVDVSPRGVTIYDSTGERLDHGPADQPPGPGDSVVVNLPRLATGAYVVTWRVVSSDSHPIRGAFTFRVGDVSDSDSLALAERLLAEEGADPLVGALYSAARAVLFASVIALLGGTAFVSFVWMAGRRNRAARLVLFCSGIGAAVSTAAAVGLQGADVAGLGISDVVDPEAVSTVLASRLGQAALIRLVLLSAIGFLVAGLLRVPEIRRPPLWRTGAFFLTAVGILLTITASGHAVSGRWVPLAVASDVVHLGAAALWLGGLALLTICARRATERTAELGGIVSRFSALATCCVAAIILTGTFQSWRQLGSIEALTSTTYGQLLGVKLALFAVAVAVAARSRAWARRFREPRSGGEVQTTSTPDIGSLRASVVVETAVAAVLILVTALLVNAVPGRSALALPHSVELRAGPDLLVDLTVDPAKAGPIDVHLYTLTPAGLPFASQEVTAQLSLPARDIGPIEVPLQRAGPNHFAAYDFDVPIAGRWQLDITVQTSDVLKVAAQATIPIR